ncbi:MAG TPA: hypothetical protein DCS08_01605 [Candidatus Moranbacteria bacterium]|nr:hypothetical protein [Candidatus Moranbacteria bacterium]
MTKKRMKKTKIKIIFSLFAKKIAIFFGTAWNKYKKLCEKITPPFLSGFLRRNYPLFLAIVFLTPAFILLFLFVNSQLHKQPTFAADFTGKIKVSKQSTTLSTNGDWYTSLANSGDGINGDAESGTFNPIHPGSAVGTEGAAGTFTFGHLTLGASTTFANGQFIGFKAPSAQNLAGVQLVFENLTTTALSNVDLQIELVRFPSAVCTTSCTNYVTGTQAAYTYPADTIVERKTIWQFNNNLSGENIQPGNFGRATFDFRFDTPLPVGQDAANTHYGIRIANFGAGAPVFGTWAANVPYGKFPTINGTRRTIGVDDVDFSTAVSIEMPTVLSGNNVITTGGMVAINSVAGVGMPNTRRTQNEHWTATYSNSSSDWTISGSVSGMQARKLATTSIGSTGASWVDDSAVMTTLTKDLDTATNIICVNSISGFAVNQYIDIWDSNTAPAQFTILSVANSNATCPSSGPAILTTAAAVVNTHNYTVLKNATVAQAKWKARIIQGAIESFSVNMPTTTKICVADTTGFDINTASSTANNVAIWDNNSNIQVNRVTAVTSSGDASCASGKSLTVATAITAGTYTIDQNAKVAEISTTLSNAGTPSNGNIFRWTSFNHTQNPIGATLLSRTSSVQLAYAKNTAPATSNTNYPFLSNRHFYFVAYGDGDTTAPIDGDIVIVGNGKNDPDVGDSSNLTNDINWASRQSHIVTINKDWNAPMAYTGNLGATALATGAVGSGAGSLGNYPGVYSSNGGWVSALVTPGSQLGIDNSENKHYRVTIPGKIVVDSDASVAFGKTGSAIPASSTTDIFFDNTSPAMQSNLTVDSAATSTLTVVSTVGLNPGDTILIRDNDTPATTRIVAAIESSTVITTTAAMVVGYTTAQSAYVAKGLTTEIPTGADRRAGIYTMTGLNAAATPAQQNNRTGRVSLYGKGADAFRTMKSDLAVDIEGNIDSGYLGNNQTDSGETWVDIKDNVVGNWQPLDNISVAGGTNQLADNIFSTIGMAGNDDANQFPVWTGAPTKVDTGAGGRNSLPSPNMEVAEIGTIPMTDIYNADYNGGSVLFSTNYNNSSAWTIFGDNANTEINDAVYFGDQGSNAPYTLEFNLNTAMSAVADYVWEYWNGTSWTSFSPRDAYAYQVRTGYVSYLSADSVNNSLTASVVSGMQANFGVDQMVAISDNDSPTIYRRISALAAGVITFTEPIPSGYTIAQGARISRLNGGQWGSISPANIFSATGRRMISWTPANLAGTPTKTTVNGVNAFWVRARISTFTSFTTQPTNQTTPIGMSGLERISSGTINVSNGTQEAKISEVTAGSSFDPNEEWMLEYGESPGWKQIVPIVPSAPYTWHTNSGVLSQNTATADFHISNGDLSWGDYTVTAKVRMRTVTDATSRKIGIVLRDTLDGNGYGALIEKTTTQQRIGIYPITLGTEGTAYSNVTKAFSDNAWYWVKANVTGTGASTVISAKFWADGSGEPGSWDTTFTTSLAQGLWNTGQIGLFGDAMIADFDDISVDNGSVVLSDSFTDTGTWRLTGSTQGTLTNRVSAGMPYSSDYLNFTLKQKGGRDGVWKPEIGDKIYLSSTAIKSYKGISGTGTDAITTSNANTKYEKWDFEWNPTTSKWGVVGSASGADGSVAPGSAFSATGNKIGLTINSGNPTSTKFGDRMLLLQDNLKRNNGSWIGSNGMGSAVLIAPSQTLTSSSITPRYNIEGQSGTATARQRGTIDFWFKTNYAGTPSATLNPKGMYLVDYANQGNSERLFIRHTPDGYLEAGIFAGAVQNTLLKKSFSATAGQWYHFRLTWNDSDSGAIINKKKAWLDGVAFTIGEGQDTVIGARGANAGLLRIGNVWTYDAPFDGSIDEFAIFDDAIDTSGSCDWGTFTPSTSAWTNAGIVGCDDADSDQGTNIFRASFDQALNPQEGFVWADYAFGNPAMIFTNGADTGNDKIRIITYPQRTRVWVDNTGDKYTPSARIKYGSGFQENATAATLAGWSNNFTYHHRAKTDSTSNPTYSPVLNLRRSTHIWSTEPITYTGATMGAPINAGNGFGYSGGIGLSGLATIDMSNVSTENQYGNFYIWTNPYTSSVVKPNQLITNSVFYNYYDRAYSVLNKTEGTNYVGADFVTTHVGAGNIGTGYNASASQNVGIDGSIFMGHRNAYVTAPPTAANGSASFFSGRLYKVNNSEFYNNGVAGAGTSGAVNFSSGVAKVELNDNIFSLNTNGIRLYGNSFFNMSNNIFDAQVADDATTNAGAYGSAIRVAQTSSSVAIADNASIFGRGLWNEADINTPANTGTFEAESLIQFTGDKTQLLSPVLFGTADYANMSRVPENYYVKTIPGADVRGSYSSDVKDIVNFTTFGNMCTTGPNLVDTTVHTSGGYAWRMEPNSSDVSLDYSAKLVGVSGKPLAATGYIKINENYGSSNLPTVTLSGLGMTGANLTWTAQDSPNTWQQFVVSGTPTESALAELKLSVKNNFVESASGTSELISNATGNYLPISMEDNDASWTVNQWVGYKLKDSTGKIFDIVKNTDKILYLKGNVLPHLLSVTFSALTPGDYIIFNEPYVYLDDVSVLSGSVDTGTLDFHSQGQPVSPWLSTGLTAEGVWNAQWSTFANSAGSFGQLLGDALVAQYADIFGGSPTTTVFNTNLTSTTDDFYLNGAIIFTEGQNKGAVRRISDYGGASKTVTVDPALPFAPAEGDRFAILAATASSGGTSGGGASAADIWSYAVRTLTDATLNSGSLATSADVANIRADITSVLTELGTGNISAIKTKTDSIDWDDVTGLITSTGDIQNKTDTINWLDISAIKTDTDTINWSDVTGIKLNTDTIAWGDITAIKANVATLILEIGTGNISAIKTNTDSINWSDITGIITSNGEIKAKTDTIDWANVTGIKTKTDTIDWDNVTGIKAKTDTIAWGDIAILQSSVNALNDISASDIWNYATRTITGEVSLTSTSRQAIWDTACTILSTTGSVGKLVCDNLDAKISEVGSSTLTAEDVWNYATRTITGFSDPALAAIANSVWNNSTKTLTSYGNDITAQNVWDVLTSSLTTVDSIGKLLQVNVDDTISSRASQDSVDAMASNLAVVLSEIGTGNISAIKAGTDSINWSDITGLVTTSGEIKLKTDSINWSDIGAIKTKTDTIDWEDITAIELKTRTIEWGDITDIKSNVATLISEIGTGNISAIKAGTDTINWSDITSIITTSGEIKAKTDTIDWNKVDEIKTKTDTIDWDDVTGIKLKTDTINWNDVDTISSRVDTTVSSRASQTSLDSHEASESTFRTSTTNTLSDISSDVNDIALDVVGIQGSLSSIDTKIDTLASTLNSIDTKIDTLDTNVDSIKSTVEDTNIKVSAIQLVVGNILDKWGSYSAGDVIGYVSALETYVGDPNDEASAETLFGRIKEVKEAAGSGGTVDLIYAQVQATHEKLSDVQLELGYQGKTTSAYDDITAMKNYVDTVENNLLSLDSRTSNIASSVSDVSSDLEDVTEKIGKVNPDSFAQHFEIKNNDIVYLKNKVIELRAVSEINRQLIEKTINEPIVKTMMEWGSVVIKFIIVNPSSSTDQKIPFKAYLPKEVRQEYIMDLGGLSLNYDATTEQYYVTADLSLKAGESITRAVEIKDIWIISQDETDSLRKQSEEMATGLSDTSYNAQAITLKTDINTRLDKLVRKQKDSNATPQDHILAYRENQEELKAINDNMKGMKDLVLNSGTGKNFLASIGGIQTFATWGIVLVLIFGMGALGFFYYALWRKKIVYEDGKKESKKEKAELPTPSPWRIIPAIFLRVKNVAKIMLAIFKKIFSLSKKVFLVIALIIIIVLGVAGFVEYKKYKKEQRETAKTSILDESRTQPKNEAGEDKEKKILSAVAGIEKTAKEKSKSNERVQELIKEDEKTEDSIVEEKEIKIETAKISELIVKETPTGWLNVRDDASASGNIIAKIYPKEKYIFSETKNGWYKIILKDKKEGWVIGDYVKVKSSTLPENLENQEEVLGVSVDSDKSITIRQTNLESVNAYEKPAYTEKIISKVYPGEYYPLLKTKNGWYKIILKDGAEGWILGEYLSVDEFKK